MDKHATYTFGYPATLPIVNPTKVKTATFRTKSPHAVATFAADAFGVACIFAALVLFLVVTP
jgi:hypothetical protein